MCSLAAGIDSEFQTHLSLLPGAVSPYLDQTLDWEDTVKIAEDMLDWEEHLVLPFKLNKTDVHDIKAKHEGKPELQRY